MKFAQRTAALVLAALLLLPAALGAEEAAAAPLTPTQRQEDLDFLYDTLKDRHPDLFAGTPEAKFLATKGAIEDALDSMNDLEFALELQSLISLVGDSHTTMSLGRTAGDFRFFPFSMLWFDGAWRLSAVDASYKDLIGHTVTALGGLPMDQVLERFSSYVSADNPVKLRRQSAQQFYVADILEHLDILQPGQDLTLTLQNDAGEPRSIILKALSSAQLSEVQMALVDDLQVTEPATAYDRTQYYFSLPLDKTTYYIQYNRCQQDPNLPMADFAARVAADLADGSYQQVFLDLRNNGGGSDGVIHSLLLTLAPLVRDGSIRLWGLIGETTYSSAVINAVMLPDMGGYLAGTPTSGSVDHFGAVNSFTLPNSQLKINHSTKWIDLATLLEGAIPYDVEPLSPHVTVVPTWGDYLAGVDTEVEYLLAHGLEALPPTAGEDALTRGRLLTLLHAAAGEPAATPQSTFRDVIPFSYYAPAVDWAIETGVAQGNGTNAFSPAQPITRAEAVVMLSRFAQQQGLTPAERKTPFSDQARIPTWAADAARLADALELPPLEGDAFCPEGGLTLTQAEALVKHLTP